MFPLHMSLVIVSVQIGMHNHADPAGTLSDVLDRMNASVI